MQKSAIYAPPYVEKKVKYCTHDNGTKDSPFLYCDAFGKVVPFFSVEYEGQT